MVNCVRSSCNESAVISITQQLCKDHFTGYFESKVKATIKKYSLIDKNDKVVVACSGGKDSTTVLYLLNKWFGNVTALAIDEGIPGYRNLTLEDLRSFCSSNDIPLKVVSYKGTFGFSLHEALKPTSTAVANRQQPIAQSCQSRTCDGAQSRQRLGKVSVLPCNICGTLRRYLLNSSAKGFTKIATGHNLDDEAQSIMMNFFKGNLDLAARLGPVTGVVKDAKFVPRVKPLHFCYEKEVAAYAFLQNFGVRFAECPHSRISFRAAVRDFLNDLEQQLPGTKQNIVNNFLKLLPRLKRKYAEAADITYCSSCGEPSSNELCRACIYVNSLKESAPTATAAVAIAKF